MLTIIAEIATALVSLFVSPGQVDALRRTAPTYLTTETAREHIAATLVTSFMTGTKRTDLLSMGWHESRYQQDAITVEPPVTYNGRVYPRWSCGVLTPEPMLDLATCRENTRSLAAGYLAGARHLRHWMDGHDSPCRVLRGSQQRWCALRGYGGSAAHEFVRRASWIEHEFTTGPVAGPVRPGA